MLRITIETTGGDVTIAQPGRSQEGQGSAAGTPSQEPPAVPTELAARAAATGALSAGPAPEGPPGLAGAPGFQQAGPGSPGTPRIDQATTSAADQPAGAAPTASESDAGVEVTE